MKSDKSISLTAVTDFLETLLLQKEFSDSSLNGLQIEGHSEVRKIGTAVDSGISVIKAAIKQEVDLLLVHHGIFWGESKPIVGPHKELVELMLKAKLSLFAAHLPLDANQQCGNNFTLCRMLELDQLEPCAPYRGQMIACKGYNKKGLDLSQICDLFAALPGAKLEKFLTLDFGPKIPKNICIVSGSGADQLYRSQIDGFDTLITGEPRQFAYHYCVDHRLNAIFAGHYVTETIGVQELAKILEQKFGIPWVFLNHPTSI